MSTLKTISAMSLSLLIVYSCHEKKKGSFSVTGTFKNADKLASMEGPVSKVVLMEVPYGKDQPPVVLDSVKISGSNGSFSLSGAARSQEVYALVFGNNVMEVPLVNDAPEIKVNVDLGKKDDFYEVSGSEATTQLKDLITIFGKKNFEVEKSMADLDSLKQSGAPDSVQLAATTKKNSTIQDLNTYLKQFINTNGNATVSALALSWSSRSFTKEDFEASLNDLQKKYPDNVVLQGLKQNYEQQLAQMADRQHQESSWVGKPAPDLALPDVNGHPIPLSSYKGKYLLVDFWASWCGPCRAENPNVVKAYSEFKNKNFAILGVSLDKDKDAWQQAIQADKLEWSHVSDLKYWNSKAVEVFKFEGIPFNVLIDPQGKIIAESLRGDELENKLKEVLSRMN
ncbi:MAG TPA: TlpA disulfide reductase family protein [Puia sp.]